ncbi:MAG: Sua5/YciO/YrdC/YwlC family protein [Woeseiaceae bacterium]|nr:Sua5/YciO/YrdC/YwlC family protein [Woeseiaceae bacterium]
MAFTQPILKASRILHGGGVIAYPTEGVFGLGCLPDDAAAVVRVLTIKNRDPDLGLILIATDLEQLDGWLELPAKTPDLTSSSDAPVTWVIPASDDAPYWIRGKHRGLAVRLTSHPVAAALCQAADSALVSTSANLHGRPATRNRFVLRRRFRALVDYIVPGACGPARGPSEIRDLVSGEVLRST